MTFDKFDTVFFTAAFLVPGFLFYWTLSIFIPSREQDTRYQFLKFLTFSCINFAVWSWLIYFIFKVTFFGENPGITAFIWFFIILISPFSLGILFAKLHQKEIIRKFLQYYGFSSVHPIPTAWDYKFIKTEPVFVLITLKDDSKVAGFFGPNSFSSSVPAERDIYLEEIFEINEDNVWKKIPNNNGIFVSGSEIKTIEFKTA